MASLEKKCDVCGQPATWGYAPAGSDQFYCDICVPRGCSCQDYDDLPCCEFEEIEPPAFDEAYFVRWVKPGRVTHGYRARYG
jgi:hypothetical protein